MIIHRTFVGKLPHIAKWSTPYIAHIEFYAVPGSLKIASDINRWEVKCLRCGKVKVIGTI